MSDPLEGISPELMTEIAMSATARMIKGLLDGFTDKQAETIVAAAIVLKWPDNPEGRLGRA